MVEKRERADTVKTSADSSHERLLHDKMLSPEILHFHSFYAIVSPCCRNDTKSTVSTAKTCGSGRIPRNIKQLLLTFAQTLWKSEPNMFISTAEPDPLPRAKFCSIKSLMSSLFLCVHCICMYRNMFMYVGMCMRACM